MTNVRRKRRAVATRYETLAIRSFALVQRSVIRILVVRLAVPSSHRNSCAVPLVACRSRWSLAGMASAVAVRANGRAPAS
jgi:hypothetical protein